MFDFFPVFLLSLRMLLNFAKFIFIIVFD
jgi:hypothetical protein